MTALSPLSTIGRHRAGLRRVADAFGSLVLPRRCLACGATVAGDGALCTDCWPAVRFLGAPQCTRCGLPFDYDIGEDAVCGACAARPPAYGRARAAFAYDDASREPVLAFKHGDRTDAAPAFSRLMMQAGRNMLAEAGLIVPVPLHRTRLLGRRYNQSALLALFLGRGTGLPVVPDLLVRTRRTPSQGGLGAAARRRNVQGAFAIRRGRANRVADARIVLVDDVMTTGATVEACARPLLRAGAKSVDVLTLARVIRPGTVLEPSG